MPEIIRDSLPLGTTMVPEYMASALKKHGIPVFKGRLFKHDGPMDQNLDDWGNPIFTHVNDNKVVLGGAVLALRYLFDNTNGYIPPTLDSIYGLDLGMSPPQHNENAKTSIKLFGVGTGGASAEKFGDVKDPDFKQKELIDWIPFRISDSKTLSGSSDEINKYFFRRQISAAPTVQYGWFLKEFENVDSVPITSRWKDTVDSTGTGSEILSDISEDTSGNLVETYAECMLKITAEDIRPYFEFNGDVTMARYNTIGLFTGRKVEITELADPTNVNVEPEEGTLFPDFDGPTGSVTQRNEYVDVRLFSVVNMDNVSVKIPSETTYLYRIYAAV